MLKILPHEDHFAQPGIEYNGENGMTYDGTSLHPTTGLAVVKAAGRHKFSVASKESLHVMVLAHARAGETAAA